MVEGNDGTSRENTKGMEMKQLTAFIYPKKPIKDVLS
jgi:hypothetical protein